MRNCLSQPWRHSKKNITIAGQRNPADPPHFLFEMENDPRRNAPTMNPLFRSILGLLFLSMVSLVGQTAGPRLEIAPRPGQVRLQWQSASNDYRLRAADSLTPPVRWRPIPSLVEINGTEHQTQVRAVDPFQAFDLQLNTLRPLRLGAYADRVVLEWDAVPGAATYNVYRGNSSGVSRTDFVQVLRGITETSVTIDGLVANQHYCFVVTPVLSTGEGVESEVACVVFGPVTEVLARFCAGGKNKDGSEATLFVPGVSAWLRNTSDGQVTDRVISEGDGYARFPDVPPGRWQLCWDAAGFNTGCSESFTIGTSGNRLPTQKLTPTGPAGAPLLWGQLTLADGSIPWLVDGIYGVNLRPSVEAVGPDGALIGIAPVSPGGSFLLPAVQCCPRITLRSTVEGARVELPLLEFPTGPVGLVVPNRRPIIQRVYATLNGVQAHRVPPGSTVQLHAEAEDPEGDVLQYQWFTLGDSAPPSPANQPTTTWTLPTDSGTHWLYLRVKDGRGGYDFQRLELVASSQFDFAGRVLEAGASAIPVLKAVVRVNGLETTTDEDGRFQLEVVPVAGGPTPEGFLLTIEREGYLPWQAELPTADQALECRLVAAPVREFAYTGQEIRLTDAVGSELLIPRDAFGSVGGVRPNGVRVRWVSLDPEGEDALPVARKVRDAAGGDRFADLVGLTYLSLTDENDRPLTANATAQPRVRLALSAGSKSRWPSLPSGTQLAAYDLESGGWRLSALPLLAGSNAYEFTPPPTSGNLFGTLIATPLAKVVVDTRLIFNFPYQVRVGNHPVAHTIHAPEANIPQNILAGSGIPVTVRVIHLKEGPGEYYLNPTNAASRQTLTQKAVVYRNTVTPILGKTNFVIPFWDVGGPGQNTVYQAPGATNALFGTQHFLSRGLPVNTFNNNAAALGLAYYSTIAAPATYNLWRFRSGMSASNIIVTPQNPPPQVVGTAAAQYYNALDLGFARSMIMAKTIGRDGRTNVAYAVSNYRTVEDAIAQRNVIATVCMDYGVYKPSDTHRFTRFYVYDSAGKLLPAADLDRRGAKAIPNLCVICHGGTPVNDQIKAGGDLGSKFLPFDLEGYTYSAVRGVQHEQLAKLNEGVLHTAPTLAISNLIVGWYGGVPGGSRINFNQEYVPTANGLSWAGHEDLYRQVFATSCRGCHISRENGIQFNDAKGFIAFGPVIESAVCAQLVMPNSERSFGVFWGSRSAQKHNPGKIPDQPTLLMQQLGITNGCPPVP